MRVLRQDLSTEQDTLAEQQADLFWAVDTLTGRGDLSDSSDAATNMLGQLVADGCVPAVRVLAQSALLYLAQDTLPDPKGKQ